MEEENQLSEVSQTPKKRGRKPKNAVQKAEDVQSPVQKKRGRKPKSQKAQEQFFPIDPDAISQPQQNGPQWRDAPEPSQEESQSQDNAEPEILFDAQNEDFAYTSSNSDKSEDDNDDDIPTSYSTTDEDLIQDNYQSSWRDDDDDADESDATNDAIDATEVLAEDSSESVAVEKNNKNNRNQQNQNRNQQNNKWRNKENRFNNKNQNNRNQQNQNRNQQNNKNRNQQNQNQQNNKNRNQQNQQNNQKNKQNKPKWLNVSADADFINPTDLFDWDALKSVEAIKNYLAKIYFGKEDNSEKERALMAEVAQALALAPQVAECSDVVKTEDIAELPTDEVLTENEIPAEAEVQPLEQPQELSYWQMLERSNKDILDEANGVSKSSVQDTFETSNEIQSTAQAEEIFTEPSAFEIEDCGVLESLDNFNELYKLPLKEMQKAFVELGVSARGAGMNKNALLRDYYNFAFAQKKLVKVSGVLDVFENGFGGAITFEADNYRLCKYSVYVPKIFIEKYSLARGHMLTVLAAPPKENSDGCPFAVKICSAMGKNPESIKDVVEFKDLTPYYPTERIILENEIHNAWNNVSMRAVDLLTPIGLGQRALIVAPPRTGKTVLMQTMAKSIRANKPNAHLMILLVDERPEEVTDFKRSIDAEVIASTFDEEATSHVHAAEMVISKARRMVEQGADVIILLDSITRLARAYNALMPNGGRTMSGGVEANALQKPKKFFGSARNIEGGGSLTIIGTALVETGSKMDEVIFEEFKGTGNLELNLDRALSDKRIFPAINMEKSGTRKEELLYHPAELEKIYTLRRAMNGVPTTDAMEMLVQRLKKTKTNVEFLLGLNR